METRLALQSNPFPSARGQIARPQADRQEGAMDEGGNGLGAQTAGFDQGILGAVNASWIAALRGSQDTTVSDRRNRTQSPAELGYRRQSRAVQPTDAQRDAQKAL